jgi:hypothetical protein
MTKAICPEAIMGAILISLLSAPVLLFAPALFYTFEVGVFVGLVLYSVQVSWEKGEGYSITSRNT